MRTEVEGGARVRLFIALELPEPLPGVLVDWRAPVLAEHHWLRAVPPESLHVTLCFLGERPLSAVEEIAAISGREIAATDGARLALAAAVWLPRRRPRVLAVELGDSDGRLVALQSRLAAGLAAAGHYDAEDRRFLAHVTVARARRGAHGRPPQPPGPPAAVADGELTVSLMRSELGGGPARYTRLGSWPIT